MKTKKFTFGIFLFLFAFFANFMVVQAQVTVYDDFEIADGPLTNDNGISGSGWSDNWTYDTKTSGVIVNNGAFEAIDGGFGLTRYLTSSIPLGTTNFYLSFIVKKSATGEFRISGLRGDGIERYSVGVKANGALSANAAMNGYTVDGDPGVIENETIYLVVAKYWYSGKGYMNIIAYKGGESIPTAEPSASTWDVQAEGGTTGVIADKFRIAFSAASVNLYDFKISDSWTSATEGIELLAPSDIKAKATSSTTATITWVDNAFNEEGTRILLDGTEVETVAADVAEYELTGLTNLTQYTVGVSAYNSTDASDTTELSFTFELDETPPTVVETSPVDNAVDVDETSDIVITFSEAMDQVSVESAITVAPALTNPVYTWDGLNKLTISADDLASETQYTVTIANTATDLSGNALAEYVTHFTVIIKDIIPPTVSKTLPANNATDILTTSSISITFSEAMDKASVEGAITIVPEVAGLSFKWNDDNVVTIAGNALISATAYTVTIGTGAMDVKGNALTAEEIVTFTTTSNTLQVYDDFAIEDGVLTNSNGSSGAGWNGSWNFAYGEGGAAAISGHISGGSNAAIVRKVNFPFIIGNTDFYISFLAYRSSEGAFRVVGGRQFSTTYQWRSGVGVSSDGSLGVLTQGGSYESSSNAGVFEANTTYLVVLKHTHKVSQQVKIFKAGDAVTEPGDGEWDYELAQGNTGVSFDYMGISFMAAGTNIDDLKMGSSWDDVSTTTITDISEIALLAPGNLEVMANSTNTAELEWSDNSVVEEGYKVYVDGVEVASLAANETFYKLKDLTEGQSYVIKVSAIKGDDEIFSEELGYTFTFDAENYVDTKIDIAKTSVTPVIDGIVDDAWANAFKNPVKRLNAAAGDLAPLDDADYQCTWSAMWDDLNLYFLIEVKDSKLVLNDGSGTNIGQDDGFDFPMATDGGSWTMNRINLVADGLGDTSIYIHEGMAAFKNAEKSFSITEGGYNIELSIVLRDFDENIGLLAEGYQFRVDVRYNDDDTEANRDAQYTWTDKTEPTWVWNQLGSLGFVTLVGVIDNTEPTVSETVPAEAATGVTLDSDIVITFSEAMDKASVEGAISVTPALSNVQYTWDGDTKVTISADDFAADTDYTLTLTAAAADANGNNLAGEFTLGFKTGFGVGVAALEVGKISVYVSENGSLLNIRNYEGMADIYSITGRKVQSVLNTSQAINIDQLEKGIYILKTKTGAVKFVK